ncbi:cache domain-containing protein [Aquabacterium sp.]|jgi:signal transduction histidine kinase|uniref:cache domain-containing protein n=1 Tax=Aquabacterium sp. TaxID=1872578 RepID=UPI00248A5019|nr:cache domain-containing protein [Aquabacterium sp.]MDI1258457.1 cache domain-containing protein [Aquabacterium sp.]
MKTKLALMLSLALSVGAFSVQAAEGGANKDDAVAMVKKGVAYVKSAGKDKAYADISDKANAEFHHQDLYLTVYALDGTVKAHGANAKMIGKNLIELKDIDGKAFVKERVDMAKTNATFWQDYKFTNPETKKIEPKSMYCEKLEDTVVCGGIYK